MSHPLTLEYMQDGKTNVSGPIGGDIKKPKRDQKGEQAHESTMMSSQSRPISICDSESVTEGCQSDEVEENPDIEIETVTEEMNITIADEERLSTTRICDNASVTEGYQTDQVEEYPDIEMEEIKEEMNITITDEKSLSFFKILTMAMIHRMEVFAKEVSILGLSYLVKSSSYKVGSVIRKVTWTMLLLFGSGFMAFQIYDRITFYQSYPTIVNYRVAYNQSLRFPTITICSQVMFSKKAILSMGNN